MNAVMVYANISAPELRARGVAEPVIQFVEHNRAHLQRTSQQQQMFRGMVQKPNMPGHAEPGRTNLDLLESFPNMLPWQQPGSMAPAGARPPPPQGPAGMNVPGTMNGQSQSQPQHKPPPVNGMAPMQASRPSRPTPEQSQEAIQFIQLVKNEFIGKSEYLALLALFIGITDASTDLPIMKQHQVPKNQRGEYDRILEQAYRCAQEVEPKLPMYFHVLKDADMVRKLIAIVRILHSFIRPAVLYSPPILQIYTTREQRAFIANGTQKFILPLSTLSTLIPQVQQINTQFSVAVGSSAPQTS